MQNTVLSALLTFSDHVLYLHYYDSVPRLAGLSALDDQSAAGVSMWVPGSVAFLLPLFGIGVGFLFGRTETRRQGNEAADFRLALVRHRPGPPSRSGFDLLRVPLLGRFLSWRHARLALQLPLAILAAVVILDGLRGRRSAP